MYEINSKHSGLMQCMYTKGLNCRVHLVLHVYAKRFARCLFHKILHSAIFHLRINFRQTNRHFRIRLRQLHPDKFHSPFFSLYKTILFLSYEKKKLEERNFYLIYDSENLIFLINQRLSTNARYFVFLFLSSLFFFSIFKNFMRILWNYKKNYNVNFDQKVTISSFLLYLIQN